MTTKYLEHLGYHTPFTPGLDCEYCQAVKIMLTPEAMFASIQRRIEK